jgi:hypothetical protein
LFSDAFMVGIVLRNRDQIISAPVFRGGGQHVDRLENCQFLAAEPLPHFLVGRPEGCGDHGVGRSYADIFCGDDEQPSPDRRLRFGQHECGGGSLGGFDVPSAGRLLHGGHRCPAVTAEG